MVDWWFVNQLFKELEILKSNNVISSECADSIAAYYNNKTREEKEKAEQVKLLEEKRKAEMLKKIPFILSCLAALFIFGGIVSLIAYNWAAIPREIKTVAAVLIAFIPAFIWLIGKNKVRTMWFKEFCSVLWTLIFGAAVAFISQIYRLPCNYTSFMLVWAFSSILITYATDSKGSFGLSALFLFLYVCWAQYEDWNSAIFFYPLFASLIPFALKLPYGLLGSFLYFSILLGNVLEKSVPGLWIASYSCLASFALSLSIIQEDRILKISSLCGILILSVMLSHQFFWMGTGIPYFRNSTKYVLSGTVCDFILTFALLGSSIVFLVKSINNNRMLSAVHAIPFSFVLLFLMQCMMKKGIVFVIEFVPYFMAAAFAILSVFMLHRKINTFFYVLFALSLQSLVSNNTLYGLVVFLIIINTVVFAFISQSNFSRNCKNCLVLITSIILILLMKYDSDDMPSLICKTESVFIKSYSTVLYVLISFVPVYFIFDEIRKHKNYLVLSLPVCSAFVLLHSSIGLPSITYTVFNLLVSLCFLCLLIFRKSKVMVIPLLLLAIEFVTLDSYFSSCFELIFTGFVIFVLGLILFFKLYFGDKEKNSGFLSGITCFVFTIYIFFSKFERVNIEIFNFNYELKDVIHVVSLLMVIAFSLAMLFSVFMKNISLNYGVIALMILSLIPEFSKAKGEKIFYDIAINFAFLAYCVFEVHFAVKKSSPSGANLYSIWLSVVFVIRFFMEDTGLVAKSVCFILCGLLILFVNIYLGKAAIREELTDGIKK